jgi:hypothetical protein
MRWLKCKCGRWNLHPVKYCGNYGHGGCANKF